MTWYRVTRDVPADETRNQSGSAIAADTIWPEYNGWLGESDTDRLIALERPDGTFFGFPRDAVEPMVLSGEGRDALAERFGDPGEGRKS